MKALVTGGAGFIGSHLTDSLIKNKNEVGVIDNLSTGCLENLSRHLKNPRFRFVKGNVKDLSVLKKVMKERDIIFHFAENSEIMFAAKQPTVYLENIIGTFNVLEVMRLCDVEKIVYSSSSTVIGDATVVPTPEFYGPLFPISLYGGAKAACEGLIAAYAHTYNLKFWIFRFVDIIGDRMDHGVVYDFVNKLKNDPSKLEILGNGEQLRSFLLVDECIAAMLFATNHSDTFANLLNIGSEDQISISRVAKIVADEMGLRNVRFKYAGGKRGWKGDTLTNFLSINNIKKLGWKPIHNSEESVRIATRRILKELQ